MNLDKNLIKIISNYGEMMRKSNADLYTNDEQFKIKLKTNNKKNIRV